MTQGSEIANLVSVLVGRRVLANASTTSNFVGSLPAPFYYKGSELSSESEYSVDLVQYQGAYKGKCFLDMLTLPIYDQVTNQKIGTVTFHDYLIKSSATSQAIVNEKLIFKFDSTDNSSITADYTFSSDDMLYPSGVLNQRIVAGTGSYLNLYGYHVVLEKRADNNRYISIVNN